MLLCGQPGNYLDVAHLVLSGVPQVAVDEERFLVLAKERESEEKERTVYSVSAVSMELSGRCEVSDSVNTGVCVCVCVYVCVIWIYQ